MLLYGYFSGQEDGNLKQTNEIRIDGDNGRSYIEINGLENRKKYLFATIGLNGDGKSKMSAFTEGQPVVKEGALIQLCTFSLIIQKFKSQLQILRFGHT